MNAFGKVRFKGGYKTARTKCPSCGSTDVAEILYGLPTGEAFRKASNGEIKLGGCIVAFDNPRKSCRRCGKDFSRGMLIPFDILKLYLFKGGNCGVSHEIKIDANGAVWKCAYFKSDESHLNYKNLISIDLNIDVFSKFIRKIDSCYIEDWEDEYVDDSYVDGTHWEVLIERKPIGILGYENREINKSGSNSYPVYFDKVLKIFSDLLGVKIS